MFAEASGLITNMDKTSFYPIRCDQIDLQFLNQANRALATFPYTYLGLLLNVRKPSRAELQPLIQKIANRIPGWKRSFFSYPGRELLVKSVLTSMPIHFLTAFKLPQWAISCIDKFRRNFFWRGKGPAQFIGGHFLVNWNTYLRPRKWGGPDFKDINKFGRALRMKWLWHSWDEHDMLWKGLYELHDPKDRTLFFNSIESSLMSPRVGVNR
jgi:hypothetical protein